MLAVILPFYSDEEDEADEWYLDSLIADYFAAYTALIHYGEEVDDDDDDDEYAAGYEKYYMQKQAIEGLQTQEALMDVFVQKIPDTEK